MSKPDAVVVGSGPNGLAAAVTLARAGLSVEVLEGAATPGGGCRSEELTVPGFVHDVCSSVHPLLVASPFFRTKDSPVRRLTLRFPEVAVAHPVGGDRAGAITGTVAETAAGMGVDGSAYRRLIGPFVAQSDAIVDTFLAPPMRGAPRRPLTVGAFAAKGILPARALAHRFSTEETRGLFAGLAAHSMRPLGAPLTGAFGLLFATLAHSVGWPVVEGGSGRLVDALIADLESLGGTVTAGRWVRSLGEVRHARAVLLDVTPRQLVDLAGPELRGWNRTQMARFRYGPGVCKVDWALAGPVPWTAEVCRRSATVHVGATFEEVARSEADVAAGRHPDHPFCIVVQAGVADPTRAPAGQQTLWAYCHTPANSTVDMTEQIEAQIERFAPGFRDLVLHRHTTTATEEEVANPNYVGGDIGSGTVSMRQTLFRPTVRWNPYRTGLDGVYLCGASTPPGAGVHGMGGYLAASTALRDLGAAVPALSR